MTVATDLLPRVKAALNITDATQDAELLDLLDAAAAEYAEHVGALPGSQSVTLSGGGSVHILPRNTSAVTAAVDSDGVAVDMADFDLDPATGLLYADLPYGRRNVVLTVTVGALPANHAATIVEDVAEYWTRTQRAGGGGRPTFGGDDFDTAAGRPLVQFPRIRALRSPSVG